MTIDNEILSRLREHNLNLDDALVLHSKYNGLKYLITYRILESTYDKLYEKKYITSAHNITQKGIEMYQYIFDTDITTNIDEKFQEFWDTYPSTDEIGRFPFGRIIRLGVKSKIKAIYLSKLKNVDPDTLLTCLKNEIEWRKTQSEKTGENKLSFMQGPLNWLLNDSYQNFLTIKPKASFVEYGKTIK